MWRVRMVAMVVATGLLVLTGCSGGENPTSDPDPSTAGSPTDPSGSPSASPSAVPAPGEAPTPTDFVATGIDCGLLDQRLATTDAEDGFDVADRCVANALRTGQSATFRLVTESLDGEALFALFAVDGPGRLTITEDHRAVLLSEIDERVKTCTDARSLSAQGNCTTREVPRGSDG